MNPAGGNAGPPPPQYPGPGVHVANPAAPQYPGPRANGGRPPPPPYPALRAHNANQPPPPPYHGPGVDYEGDGGDRWNKHRREASSAVVQTESRKRKWAMFLVGNLISVAVVVSEIAELSVCFDENLSDDEDTPQENASSTYGWMMFSLILGLWVDVFSAVALSVIYRSPLDIKSAHKIPPGDMRNCGGTAMINFLAPFFWGLVYFSGGFVSIMYGENSPCGGGVGGSALEEYLRYSGVLMALFSAGMLMLSVIILPVVCCSSSTQDVHRTGTPRRGCCTRTRDMLHKRVLSKSPIFDLGWQLQGVVLSYRVGAFSLATAFLVGSSGVVGEVLAAFGSLAPEEVQELVGPIIV